MDVGFVGFNTYSRPDQLPSGMLANSSNGRIGKNGEWQVRKGISAIKAPFASGDAVLRLPTSSETQVSPAVVGLLPTTIRSASLASDKALIVIDDDVVDPLKPGHVFAVGDKIFVEGLTGTPDPNGSHTVTAVTDNGTTRTIEYDLVGTNVAAYGGFALTLPFNLDDGGTEPALTTITLSPVIGFNMVLDQGNVAGVYSSTTFSDPNQTNSQFIILASNVSAVATDLNDTSVSITMGYPSGENVPPASSMLQAFNKIFIFRDGQTALENDKFFSPVSIASASTGAASNIVSVTTSGKHGLVIGDAITIAGLTGFPGEGDPAVLDQDPNGTWTVKTVPSDTSFTYDLPVVYQDAATYTVSAASKISPAFKRVESGTYTQPTQIVCTAGEFAIINGRGIVHQSTGVRVGDTVSVVGDKTLDADQTSGFIIGETFIANKVFNSGSDQSIASATSDLISGGEFDGLNKVTATVTGHGYEVGDPINVSGYTSPDTDINGPRFVAERTTDTFVFYVSGSVSTNPNAGTPLVALADGFEFFFNSNQTSVHVTDGLSLSSTPVFSRPLSVGLGFSHMPAPEYATYHQRRLVMPFKYTVNDAEDSFTYRKILDEVITSDILDSDTYDQVYAQFRFNAGTADFNVGLHSFSDDKLLVFNRNSIHLVGGAGQSAATQLITNEVGCVARKSIIQVGNNVLFLSDNGVYGANFQDLYNLRGNEVPLSSPINPIIQRINRDVWDKSVGVYFDNRYYLAVPLDGSQVNNAILIFNFINKQWESIDTTNAPNWDISDLIVGGKKSDRAVYAINSQGGVHRLDARVQAKDLLATTIPVSGVEAEEPYDVPASVTTRQFTLGSMDRKRWNNLELHVQSSVDEASDLSISAELENLDTTVDLGSLSALNSGTTLDPDEDVSVRGRIGNKRAYGMQVTLNNTVGRPRFRGIKVGGAEAFRSTNTAI